MKKILSIYLISVILLISACSEKVTPNPDLGGPLYGLTKGEPGSLEELIYNTWNFAVCIIYMIIVSMLFKPLIGLGALIDGILL